jgi:predicted metalloprotease with PDZ domain
MLKKISFCFAFIFLLRGIVGAQENRPDTLWYHVGMEERAQNQFKVQLRLPPSWQESIDLRMPAWSPGYYQLLHFAKNVSDVAAKNPKGETLRVENLEEGLWRIHNIRDGLNLSYTVTTPRHFVANAYIDQQRAFIKPAALFLHEEGKLNIPVVIDLEIPSDWPVVATGLDLFKGIKNQYFAPDIDILYDSPLLIGDLQSLPEFEVNKVPHRFIGFQMGEFDGAGLMQDLKKIIQVSVDLIGHLPYNHYTFIGLGPGQGGIEQLNSTAVSFTGNSLEGNGRLGMLSFLAHEYFHHYNVKRIRPIELGPFDYRKPNRTQMLWVAEGLTVYYENVLLNRAGLMDGDQILSDWSNIITSYESNEGKTKQTLAASSWETWEDGPFGRRGETISYYEKGPIIGILLDLSIRVHSENKQSLDDVMRRLYHDIYLKRNRGFTQDEIRSFCEQAAGQSLREIFDYIYTTKPLDYNAYLNKAGLQLHWEEQQTANDGHRKVATITRVAQPTPLQQTILNDMFRGGLTIN